MAVKPKVTIFSTESLDGRINGRARRLSCPFDLQRLHKLRAESDAVMIGASTVIIDDPQLTVRLVPGRNPLRVVVDGALRTPLTARIYDTSTAPTLVATTRMSPPARRERLRAMGVEVLVVGSGPEVDLEALLAELAERGVRRLLVEGGGRLNWALLSGGLVDEVRATISPLVLGSGPSFFSSASAGRPIRLELETHELCGCGQEIHLVYRVMP